MMKARVYKCAICGSMYDNLQDRINCETACLSKQEQMKKEQETKARLEALRRKQEEQTSKREEIDHAEEHLLELIDQYINDYGSLEYHGIKMYKTDEDTVTLNHVLKYFF